MAEKNWTKPILYALLVNGILMAGEVGYFAYNKFLRQNPEIIQTQTATPQVKVQIENPSLEQRTITTTLVPTTFDGKIAYSEATSTTNYSQTKTRERSIVLSPQESLEKRVLEQAIKSSLGKKVQQIPLPPAQKQNSLDGCTAKAEQKTNSVVEESKHSLKQQESSGKINAYHKKTGAAGYFGYLPQTAIGIVKQAKAEGIDVPYIGPLTESAVQKELLTNSKFNEFIADYDLTKRAKIFDNNRGLLAMTHYAGPKEIEKSLKIVYPGKEDYTNIDVREFAFARAKGIKIIETEDGEKKYVKTGKGNAWLLKPQDYGCPSILKYAESVLGKMGYASDSDINSIPAYVLSEHDKPSQYNSSVKKYQKNTEYKQKTQNRQYVSTKHYHPHKKSGYKHK